MQPIRVSMVKIGGHECAPAATYGPELFVAQTVISLAQRPAVVVGLIPCLRKGDEKTYPGRIAFLHFTCDIFANSYRGTWPPWR